MQRFNLKDILSNKELRHAWGKTRLYETLALQIRLNRQERNWSQGELAKKAGISLMSVWRLEHVRLGGWTINTLIKIAAAFDCALIVRFIAWGELIELVLNQSAENLIVKPFIKDFINFGSKKKRRAKHEG